MAQKLPIYTRFWFVWLAFTVIYLSLYIFNTELDWIPSLRILVGAFGMFVPLGIYSILASLIYLRILVVVPLLILSMYFADTLALRWGITTAGKKFLFVLAWLFILTLLTDLFLYGKWYSLTILLTGRGYTP